LFILIINSSKEINVREDRMDNPQTQAPCAQETCRRQTKKL
jgi:hypothetical protein